MCFHQTILARNICHVKHRLLSLSAQNCRPHLWKRNESLGVVEIGSINTLLGIPKVSRGGRKPTITVIWDGLQVPGKKTEKMASAFTPHNIHPTPLLKQQLGDAISKIKTHHMRNYGCNGYFTSLDMVMVYIHTKSYQFVHFKCMHLILCQLCSVNLFKTNQANKTTPYKMEGWSW